MSSQPGRFAFRPRVEILEGRSLPSVVNPASGVRDSPQERTVLHEQQSSDDDEIIISMDRSRSAFVRDSNSGMASPSARAAVSGWSLKQNGDVLEIAYGSGRRFPQYGALHKSSGYFRLNYGPKSGWGTSVILPPSFWLEGEPGPRQGAPVGPNWKVRQGKLIVTVPGHIGGLDFRAVVTLSPPGQNRIVAKVTMMVAGVINLADDRPGEAFKPVMLSSMHVSENSWDAKHALVGDTVYQFPEAGWIIQPPVNSSNFGLEGGTSFWKTNAPTVLIKLDRKLPITGWRTDTKNPNDDGIGLWAGSETVLRSYHYQIITKKPLA